MGVALQRADGAEDAEADVAADSVGAGEPAVDSEPCMDEGALSFVTDICYCHYSPIVILHINENGEW
jgi:hypothetical protein